MLRTDNLKIAERIGSAIYFVTNFFDEKEPLRWRLRTLATDLVSFKIKDILNVVSEISSLFVIAKNAGLVSDMNYDILIKELSRLEDNEKKSLNIPLLAIEKNNEESSNLALPTVSSKPKIKDKSVKKNSRQELILTLIRRKKEVMIKDISPLISGLSDKTIQRELLAMVKDGIIRKSGEKRWSRYSLA